MEYTARHPKSAEDAYLADPPAPDVCMIPYCGRLPESYMRIALCLPHAFDVFVDMQAQAHRKMKVTFPEMPPEPDVVDRARKDLREEQSLVYYVQLGQYIKIGFTTNLKQRLRGFRVPPSMVLATEPGGRSMEKQRHEQFAKWRVGRSEDFHFSNDLTWHIDSLVQTHGPARITEDVSFLAVKERAEMYLATK